MGEDVLESKVREGGMEGGVPWDSEGGREGGMVRGRESVEKCLVKARAVCM